MNIVRTGKVVLMMYEKRKILFMFFIFTVSSLFAQDSSNVTVQEGRVVVIITNIPENVGTAMVALSNSKEDYEKEGIAFMGRSAEVAENRAEVEFENIPYGIYAIKVFHDEDEDGELDTNFLGIPSEAYGFSNNARGSFGPAAWEDAKFTFSSEKDTLFIFVD